MNLSDAPADCKSDVQDLFVKLPLRVLLAPLAHSTKVCYAVLARYADREGHCFPSQRRLADDLGCSTMTVKRHLAVLHKAGLIEVSWQITARGWHRKYKLLKTKELTRGVGTQVFRGVGTRVLPELDPVLTRSKKPDLFEQSEYSRTEISRMSRTLHSESTTELSAQRVEPQTAKPVTEHMSLLRYFCDHYERQCGLPYRPNYGKDLKLLKRLLAARARPLLERLIDLLLTTDDPWIAGTDRGVGVLSVKAQWLEMQLTGHAKSPAGYLSSTARSSPRRAQGMTDRRAAGIAQYIRDNPDAFKPANESRSS